MKKIDSKLETFKSIFNNYLKLIQVDPVSLSQNRAPLNLIRYSAETIASVCEAATSILKSEPSIVVNTTSPAIIVGDIHGQLIDLLRLFKENGLPNKTKYIFLGDYIDRGQFNIDVILFLLILKILFNNSNNLILLRGNHEFHTSCLKGGFFDEVGYSEIIYSEFMTVFSYLPICAIVDNRYFLVHGGIGPTLSSLNQIESIKKPIYHFSDDSKTDILIDFLLWSDPNAQLSMFHESTRKIGCMFGRDALSSFLSKNNLSMLIRGHESIYQGYEYQFDKLCLTVFSASNYCGRLENDGAIILLNNNDIENNVKIKVYPPLSFLGREKAVFIKEKELTPYPKVSQDVIDTMKYLHIESNYNNSF